MNVTDHSGLRQGEEIAVVQQVLLRVLEALPANVGFLHAVGTNRRAHRSVDDGDPTFEDVFKRMLMGLSHMSSMVLGMGTSQEHDPAK
jgi:hypothetical protein